MTDQGEKEPSEDALGDMEATTPPRRDEVHPPQAPCHECDSRKKHHTALEYLTFGVHAVTFIALVFYACFTYRIAVANGAAAHAAEKAARAAIESNGLTKKSLTEQHRFNELDHRAWLLVASATAPGAEVYVTGATEVRFRVQNIGKAPAFNVRAEFRWLPIGMDCAEEEKAIPPGIFEPIPRLIPNIVIDAGASTSEMPHTLFGVFNQQERAEVVTGLRLVFLLGVIQYDDVVGIGRSTRFCGRYEPDSFVPVKVSFK